MELRPLNNTDREQQAYPKLIKIVYMYVYIYIYMYICIYVYNPKKKKHVCYCTEMVR